VLVSKDLNLNQSINYGDWSALISSMLFAGYMLSGKKARHHYDNNFYAVIQYLVCAVCFLVAVGLTGADLTGYDDVSWYSIAGLVFISTFLGHLSFTYLVKFFELGLLTCGKLIEPVFATIIAYYMFGETLTYHTAIAFALTAGSLVILFYPVLKRAIAGMR
jgi:drug/metabolite transporter (DMT)-like permease